MSYLNNSNLPSTQNSTYFCHCFTGIAVIKLYSEIFVTANDGKFPILLLLDLSAAFDIFDHNTLLKRLKSTYGFDGSTFKWFLNYLSNKSFNVPFGETESVFVDFVYILVGVPQGSVLRPFLFPLYNGVLE